MPTSTKPRSDNEFFYIKDHRVQDQRLHDALIADGDETKARLVSDRVARRIGLTEEEIVALRPKTSK